MPSKKTPSVFVRGLPYSVTQEQLSAHFSSVAPVRHAIVVCDPKTHESKGFGFVQFAFEEDARLSCEKLHGSQLEGRRISVEVASSDKKGAGERGSHRPARNVRGEAAQASVEAPQPPPERPAKRVRYAADAAAVRDDSSAATSPSAAAAAAAPRASAPQSRNSASGKDDGEPPAAAVTSVRRPLKKGGSGAAPALESGAEEGEPVEGEDEPPAVAPAAAAPAAPPLAPPPAKEQEDKRAKASSRAARVMPAAAAAVAPQQQQQQPLPAGLTRDRMLYLFGLPPAFDKKRLWKRVKKLNGASDLSFPVVLPGNAQCAVATLLFATRAQREKAAKRLSGHSLLGHKLAACGADQLLARKDAFTKGRLIVRNLRFDATPQHIMNACHRCSDTAAAAVIVHIHVPVKPGSPLPPPPRMLVSVSAGPARAAYLHSRGRRAVSGPGSVESDEEAGSGVEADAAGSDVELKDEESEDEEEKGDAAEAKEEEDEDASDADDAAGAAAATAGPKYRNRGFAFVEFATRAAAEAALAALNGQKVHRRKVVVDWALSQEAFAAAAAAAAAAPDSDSATAVEGAEAKPAEKYDGQEDDEDGTAESGDNAEAEAEGDDDDAEAVRSGAGSDAEDASDMDAAAAAAGGSKGDSVEAGTTLFVQNLPFDATSEQLKDVMSPFGGVRYAQIVMDRNLGRSKGSGFVQFYEAEGAERALAAAMTGPEAEAAAEKCAAPERGGTPAEKAKRRRQADAVLACIRSGGILLDSRALILRRAVAKGDAERLDEEGIEKRAKKRFDKRHTHLAYEGNVRAGSDVAAKMPAADLVKREAAAKEKKLKLKSPLFFVSPTRLSIRNLAKSVDDAALRLLCIKATLAGIKAGLVQPGEGDPALMPPRGTPPATRVALKSARVMRETGLRARTGDAEGVGGGGASEPRSKGYAFVEFLSHLHALTCLRQLNNNPAYSHLAAGGAAVGAA